MIGIYQIFNTRTQLSYVGQSKNIERRISEHKRDILLEKHSIPKEDYDKLEFVVLEECSIDSLNELEIEWISYFDSFENGYNKTRGGGASDKVWEKSQSRAENIISYLKDERYSFDEISQYFDVHPSTVYRINSGQINNFEKESYPIREVRSSSEPLCIDCGIAISSGSTRCRDCYLKSATTDGKPSKEELLETLFETPNFSEVGRMFKVSDNTIKKWCKSYELPHLIDFYKPVIKKRSVTHGSVLQLDIETGEILNEFESAVAAGEYLGNKDYNKHISSVCTGKRKSAYGYRWRRIK